MIDHAYRRRGRIRPAWLRLVKTERKVYSRRQRRQFMLLLLAGFRAWICAVAIVAGLWAAVELLFHILAIL